MEKKLVAIVVLMLVIVVFVAAYWATEPGRQATAAARFKEESIARGAGLYVEACSRCHGTRGQGLVGPALKGSRLDERGLEKTISRGVSRTAMPAWGQEDGGPFKADQIHDLAVFIKNWDDGLLAGKGAVEQPTTTKTQTSTPPVTSRPASPVPTTTPAAIPATPTPSLASTPVAPTPIPSPTPKASTTPSAAGRQLFSSLGCIACHGTNGEGSQIAPAVAGLAGKEVELASAQKVIADDAFLRESIVAPNAKIVKGYVPDAMPKPKLTDAQVDQLVEFIKSLK
ncbi:MAG: c-type cytochrome [Chloroflexi bacterium]|nr:c-type cytochrome [Chloroflexota bacterium]